MDYSDWMIENIRKETGLTEYKEDEFAKKILIESNEPFRRVVELYEKTLRDEKTKGLAPFKKPVSEKLKRLIDIFVELNKFDFSGYDKDSELVAAIHKELTEITLYSLDDLKISKETRDYISNHPEVRLYRAKGKVTIYYMDGCKDETNGVEHFLFETDEKRIRHRINLGYKIEALSYPSSHPVRTARFDICEFKELDLKCLDSLSD